MGKTQSGTGKVRPLISYYGGKQRMASKIISHLEKIPHTVRAIPFAGGLGVWSAWDEPIVTNGDHFRTAINDINQLIINLYRVCQRYPDKLQSLINKTLYSEYEYGRAKEICKEPESAQDTTELAWATYVNCNMSFSHHMGVGWGRGKKTRDWVKTWNKKNSNIPFFSQKVKNCNISCCDALKFIQDWDSPQTLFYLDPPYPGTDQGHYGGYTQDDFAQLCQLLDESEGSYVLSNYDQGDIYPRSAQDKVRYKTKNSSAPAHSRGKSSDREEVLWICDRSENIPEDLRKIALKNVGIEEGSLQISLF